MLAGLIVLSTSTFSEASPCVQTHNVNGSFACRSPDRPHVQVNAITKATTKCDDHFASCMEGPFEGASEAAIYQAGYEARHQTFPLHVVSLCSVGGEHIPMMQMQSSALWCFHPTSALSAQLCLAPLYKQTKFYCVRRGRVELTMQCRAIQNLGGHPWCRSHCTVAYSLRWLVHQPLFSLGAVAPSSCFSGNPAARSRASITMGTGSHALPARTPSSRHQYQIHCHYIVAYSLGNRVINVLLPLVVSFPRRAKSLVQIHVAQLGSCRHCSKCQWVHLPGVAMQCIPGFSTHSAISVRSKTTRPATESTDWVIHGAGCQSTCVSVTNKNKSEEGHRAKIVVPDHGGLEANGIKRKPLPK